MAFKENPDTTLRLVANGVLLSCNPDRVILKRVVLSGHPLKVCWAWRTYEIFNFTKIVSSINLDQSKNSYNSLYVPQQGRY